MDPWEYITIEIRSQGQQPDHWYIVTREQVTIQGMDTILNTLRQRGWELVSLVPVAFAFHGLAPEATRLLAILKRPCLAP